VAQLTQKTNQFNLTTKRYTEQDIQSFISDDNADVFYLRLEDCYGDYGIVGVSIIKYENQTAEFDSFLM